MNVYIRRDKVNRRKTFIEQLKEIIGVNKKTCEIGVAAGDFSRQIIDVLNVKHHTMVDPWTNEGDEKRSQWFTKNNDAKDSYNYCLERFKDDNVNIIKKYSHEHLISMLEYKNKAYDFIYIDGDHHAEAVYLDLMLSYELLQPKGVLAGDDYNWKSKTTGRYEVQIGVNYFEQTHGISFNIVKGDDGGMHQYYFQKK